MKGFLRRVVLSVQRRCTSFDSFVSRRESDSHANICGCSPIFILGAPRTGTTVLFLAMADGMCVSYVSNLMALLPCWMVRMCACSRRVASGYRRGLVKSRYGYVPGMLSPNEAGALNSFWFCELPSDGHRKNVQRTFYEIERLTGWPVLIKNVFNATRVEFLRSIFPQARFIVVKRDLLYAAQSILLARRKLQEKDRSWWSVPTPGWQKVEHRDPYYQVVWQVWATTRHIEESLRDITNRVSVVHYEQFCVDPAGTLARCARKLGIKLRTGSKTIAESILLRNTVRLPDNEWKELQDAQDSILCQRTR